MSVIHHSGYGFPVFQRFPFATAALLNGSLITFTDGCPNRLAGLIAGHDAGFSIYLYLML